GRRWRGEGGLARRAGKPWGGRPPPETGSRRGPAAWSAPSQLRPTLRQPRGASFAGRGFRGDEKRIAGDVLEPLRAAGRRPFYTHLCHRGGGGAQAEVGGELALPEKMAAGIDFPQLRGP